jgi:hypothetical protein
MEQWTVEEVAIWLICIGLADNKVERFKNVAGPDLSTITKEDLIGLGLDQDQAERLLQHVEFTKSVSNLEELAAELEAVKLAKKELEEQLVAKDEKISELEKLTGDDGNPEDHLLAMEHRHEIERRRLEEHHEGELRVEEIDIHHKREVAKSTPDKEGPHLGKKHFKEEPVDLHRYY